MDGEASGALTWQSRSWVRAVSRIPDAVGPPCAVSPRQCMICACSCHWPAGLMTVASAATA